VGSNLPGHHHHIIIIIIIIIIITLSSLGSSLPAERVAMGGDACDG